jgi:hypothetical protein
MGWAVGSRHRWRRAGAHTVMGKQALNSEKVRNGLKEVLINHAGI